MKGRYSRQGKKERKKERKKEANTKSWHNMMTRILCQNGLMKKMTKRKKYVCQWKLQPLSPNSYVVASFVVDLIVCISYTSHAEEISPLFGTGKIPDEESSASNHNDGIVFGESPSNKGYGAINNNDSEDEEDDNSQKKNANKPMGLFGSLSQKIKNRRRTSLSSSTTVSGVSGTSGASSSNGNKNNNKDNTKKQQQQNKTSKIVITESGKPEYPHRNCMLSTFCFLEAFGVVTSLCLMATQVIPMLVIKNTWSELGAMNIVLKIYISLFCLLFVLLEWDAPIPFVKDAVFLQRYFSRGKGDIVCACVCV